MHVVLYSIQPVDCSSCGNTAVKFKCCSSQNSSIIIWAFLCFSLKRLHIISILNYSSCPHCLDSWSSDHCLLGTAISCRACDVQAQLSCRVRGCLIGCKCQVVSRTPPPTSIPSSSRLVYTPLCLEKKGWVLSKVHARANILSNLNQFEKNGRQQSQGQLDSRLILCMRTLHNLARTQDHHWPYQFYRGDSTDMMFTLILSLWVLHRQQALNLLMPVTQQHDAWSQNTCWCHLAGFWFQTASSTVFLSCIYVCMRGGLRCNMSAAMQGETWRHLIRCTHSSHTCAHTAPPSLWLVVYSFPAVIRV